MQPLFFFEMSTSWVMAFICSPC